MKDEDYPNIFQVADHQSKKAQKQFVGLNLGILLLIIFATLIFTFPFLPEWIYKAAAVMLILSTAMTILVLFFRPEKMWYDGRAIAESAKSLTWKFMMRTSPFEHKLSMEEAEDRLIKNLKKIIGQKKDFYKLIGEQFGDGDQVTMQMKTIRNCSLSERIKTYSSQRIEDQRKWYLKKTKGNRKGKNIVFIILIGLQIIAFCSIIAEINDAISIFLMPFLACLTASTIAFLQLKRFQELTESYAITATELGLIKSKFHHIKSEDDLQNFVDDAETAVSREHTLWLARRDSTELFD